MANRKQTAGKTARVNIAESKLPDDKKLTKESIIGADKMDAEIQKKLFDIPQSINAHKNLDLDSDKASSILDVNSQNPPSHDGEDRDQVSEGEETGLIGEDGQPIRLNIAPAKTDIHAQAKLDSIIDEKNPYRFSQNAGYGDLNKVFAFEVENNISKVLQSILKPIVTQHEKAVLNIVDLQTGFSDVLKNLDNVNRKLDSDTKMRDTVADAGENTKALGVKFAQEQEFVHKKLLELKQMQGLHDDRMTKYRDEKGMFERKHDMMRDNIREFETLAQDISRINAERFLELKKEMAEGFGKVWEELEALKFEKRKATAFMQMHKQQFSKLSTAIGVIHYNIDEIDEQMKDFHTLNQTLADTEQYLGYVLPLKIEETMYKNLMSIQEDNDKRLTIMENTQEVYTELKQKLNTSIAQLEADSDKFLGEGKLRKVPYATFDKKCPFIPDLKEDIKEMIKTIRQEEKEEFGSDIEGMEGSVAEQSKKSRKSIGSKVSSNAMLKSKDSGKKAEKSITEIPLDQKSNGSDTEKESPEQFQSFSSVKEVGPNPKKSMTVRTPTKVLTSRSDRNPGSLTGQNAMRGSVALHDVKLNPQDVFDFANRVGRNLLQNEKFLDKLADALDGIEIAQSEDLAYDSETEMSPSPQPISPNKLNYLNYGLKSGLEGQTPAMGSIKEEGYASRDDSKQSLENSRNAVIQKSPTSRRNRKDSEPVSQDHSPQIPQQVVQQSHVQSEKSKTPMKGQQRAVTKRSTNISQKFKDQGMNNTASNIKGEVDQTLKSETDASQIKSKFRTNASKQDSRLSRAEMSGDKSHITASKIESEQSDEDHQKYQGDSKLSGAQTSIKDPPKVTPSGRRGKGRANLDSENSPRDKSFFSSPIDEQNQGSRRRRGEAHDGVSSPGLRYNGDVSKDISELQKAVKDLKASHANLEKRLKGRGEGGLPDASGFIESNLPSENDKQNSSIASMTKLNTFKDSSPILPSGDGDLQTPSGEYVTVALFKKQDQTLQHLRENIRVLRSKVSELESESKGRKELMSQLDPNDGEAMLQLRQSIDDRLEEVELMKDEMRKELKRLQRQDVSMHLQFDKVFQRLHELQNEVDAIGDRITVSDNAMAVIFKLLRIQYALCHQDELDKQDIFLMGAKESTGGKVDQMMTSVRGSTNNVSQLNQNSIDLAQNSISSSANPGTSRSKKKQGGTQAQSHFGIDVPVISTSGGHSLMTFDKNCMQCGGAGNAATQIPTLIKAFKMACLSYKPSPVHFESKTFERNQLIEAEGYLLYLALKQMSHLDLNAAEKNLLGANAESVAAAATISGSYSSGQFGNYDLLMSQAQHIEKGKKPIISKDASTNPALDDSLDYIGADQSVDSIYEHSFHGQMPGIQASKVISTQKSREYTKLANQVPSIYEIKGGQKTLAQRDSKIGPTSGQKIQGSMTGPVVRQNIKAQEKLKRNQVYQNRKQSQNRDQQSSNQNSGPRQVFNFNTINVVGSSAAPEQMISPTSPANYFQDYMNQPSNQREINFSTARETRLREDPRLNTLSGKQSDNLSQKNAAHSVVDGGEALNPLFGNTMNNMMVSPRVLGTAAGPQRNMRGGQVHGVNIKQKNTARQSLVVMGHQNLPSLNSGSIQLQTINPMIAPNTARSGIGISKNQGDFTTLPSSGNHQNDFIKSQIFSQGRQPTAPTSSGFTDSRGQRNKAQGQVPETIKESNMTSPDLQGPQSARLPDFQTAKLPDLKQSK